MSTLHASPMIDDCIRSVRKPRMRRLVLDDFEPDGDGILESQWAGFTDRVMGGRSDGSFSQTSLLGKRCLRLTGDVTREGGGGFAQMAVRPGGPTGFFDLSAFAGLEVLAMGNNQHYNIHIRTADVAWYNQSYRATFFAPARWQKFCFAWSDFKPHGIDEPMDTSVIQRIGFLGWMREFRMDLAIGEVAFFA